MKHAFDLMLYEAQDKSDLEATLKVLGSGCLELFAQKSGQEVTTLRYKVREHIVWKSEPIWRLRLRQILGVSQSSAVETTENSTPRVLSQTSTPVSGVSAASSSFT
jgi:hypothetical protein